MGVNTVCTTGVNTVCTLQNGRKTRFVDFFSLRGQKTQLSLSRHARDFAGDVFLSILVTSLKFGDVIKV